MKTPNNVKLIDLTSHY